MYFKKISELLPKEIIPGYKGRFIHTENLTFAFWNVDAGAPLPEHSHPQEQLTQVVNGQFEFTVEGEVKLLTPGWIAVIPPNSVHAGRAVTDCQLVDIFYPKRGDLQ